MAASAPCSAFHCCGKARRSGSSSLQRKTVRPFTDKQIELVTTFADQAVIAIENVRLFDEVQARTRELVRGAGAADGDLEVLQVIQLAGRAGAGIPGHAGERGAHLRGEVRHAVLSTMAMIPHRCAARRAAGLCRRAAARTVLRPGPRTPSCRRCLEQSRWPTSTICRARRTEGDPRSCERRARRRRTSCRADAQGETS